MWKFGKELLREALSSVSSHGQIVGPALKEDAFVKSDVGMAETRLYGSPFKRESRFCRARSRLFCLTDDRLYYWLNKIDCTTGHPPRGSYSLRDLESASVDVTCLKDEARIEGPDHEALLLQLLDATGQGFASAESWAGLGTLVLKFRRGRKKVLYLTGLKQTAIDWADAVRHAAGEIWRSDHLKVPEEWNADDVFRTRLQSSPKSKNAKKGGDTPFDVRKVDESADVVEKLQELVESTFLRKRTRDRRKRRVPRITYALLRTHARSTRTWNTIS